MIFQFRRYKGLLVSRNIFVLSFINMFLALAVASISVIWAVYINGFVQSDSITGFISGLLALVSFISYFIFIPLIQKSKKSILFVYTLFMVIITYILFWVNRSFVLFLLLSIFVTAVYTIRSSVFGIIVKDKSKRKDITKNEGFIYTFMNAGWILGPLAGGYIASVYGNEEVFLFAAICSFVAMAVFGFSRVRDGHSDNVTNSNIYNNFVSFFGDRERVLAYLFRGGTFVWWVLIYIFMPLYIIQNGFSEIHIGYYLFSISIPLIFTEYLFSNFASRFGFKKMFSIGFAWTAVFAFLSFFAQDTITVLTLTIFAGIGIAMLEPTTEAYFLKNSSSAEASRFIGPFNTGVDAFQTIGKVLASLLLLILPFNYIFLLFSFFMLVMFFVVRFSISTKHSPNFK